MYELEKGHVIASILECKIKCFNEYYVTYEEANVIKKAMQERLKEEKVDAYITNEVDNRYFTIHPVYAPVYTPQATKYHYEFIPNVRVTNIVWDEIFIITKLQEIYQEKLEYLKKVIDKNSQIKK